MRGQRAYLYEFGPFSLNAQERLLTQKGKPVPLASKTFEALLFLVQNAGHLVTKDELIKELWLDTFVEESNLAKHISLLRKALGGNDQEYIETVPKYGYRFVSAVRERNGVATIEEDAQQAKEAAPVSTLGDDTESPRYVETLPRRGYRFLATVTSEESVARARKLTDTSTPFASSGVSVKEPIIARGYIPGLFAAVALLVVAWGVYRWTSHRYEIGLPHMQIVKLTDNGQASGVAITPDGRYVVYAFRAGEKEGLRLRQVASRQDVEILPADSNEFHGLTISPDGDYVYFVRSDKNDPLFKYLYSMPVLGGAPKKLITDVDSPVSFSPDAHRFVYEHCIPTRNEIELKIADTRKAGESLLATLNGVSCSLFQPGPNWSPDGKTIVVPVYESGKKQRWAMYALSASNGRARLLYTTVYDIGRPVWLRGGKALLIPHSDSGGGVEQLWTLSFPEGEMRRMTSDLTEYATELDITRDKRTVAAVARSTASNVWLVSAADPLGAQQITSGSLPMIDAAFSADGKVLSISLDSKLWATNPDGNGRALFAEEAGWLTPCGRFVIFASYKEGGVALTRINPDGSNATKMVTGSVWKPLKTSLSTRAPVCSQDGKFIYYLNSDHPQKICRAPVLGGSFVEIAETLGDGIAGRLSISPDGEYIAYIYDQYSGTITPGWKLVVIPAGGGPTLTSFEVPGGASGPRWSPDGTGLQYLLTNEGITNIWEQPLAGGPPRQLTRFTSGKVFEFARSEDGKRLLLCRGEVSSDVVLMSNFY